MREFFRSILDFRKAWFKKFTIYAWVAFILIMTMIPLYIYSVSIDLWGLYGPMPSVKVLENPENDLSSEVITADGVSLGRYYRYNRSQVTFDQLSPQLVNTLISSEDIRYFSHSGLDFIAYLRVLKGLLTLSPDGGGSTITQQLAKNLYTQNREMGLDGKIARWGSIPRRIVEKSKEWIISVYLERNFTKEEIVAMYLNTAPFSSNAYGIKVAGETYFGKTTDSLNYQESAVLVGMLQATTYYNPVRNPGNAMRKRNQVLYDVHKQGFLSKEEYDSVKTLPIDVSKYNVQSHITGNATYFREVLKQDLISWCKANGYDLFEDGLKIYITLDSRMQEYMEQAVEQHMAVLQESFFEKWDGRDPWIDDDHKVLPNFLKRRIKETPYYEYLVERYGEGSDSIKIELNRPRPMTVFSWKGEIDTVFTPMDSLRYYKHFLHTGFMAMDPHTGQVRAWVGGINQKYFQFDHVKQGTRQPGSIFKGFVYGLAMSYNYSPCLIRKNVSPPFPLPDGTIWKPENAEGGYGDGSTMTLRQAMARSVNSVTAQVMQELRPENVVKFANAVGIESDLMPVPSLCLGTSDVSLFELLGAYSTFVNKGLHIKPYYIAKIEDKYGNVIYNTIPETRQGTDEETAYKVLYMLRGGVEEDGGTSRGLSRAVKEDNEIAGKTGTTNNASDGWYVGLTKDLVAGGWVGGDERSIHFERWSDGSGARTARPIWDLFMQNVYADTTLNIEKGPFPRPIRGIDAVLDCDEIIVKDSVEIPLRQWNPDNIE